MNVCDPKCLWNFFPLKLHLVLTEICSNKILRRIFSFSTIRTHDIEVLNPNYNIAHLIYLGNIDAKFEESSSCSN